MQRRPISDDTRAKMRAAKLGDKNPHWIGGKAFWQPNSITQQRKKQRLRAAIYHLKDKPCADCKQSFPRCAMDFDHLGLSPKLGNVAALISEMQSVERVLAEAAKCEVVCSNCHRIRTSKRRIERFAKAA